MYSFTFRAVLARRSEPGGGFSRCCAWAICNLQLGGSIKNKTKSCPERSVTVTNKLIYTSITKSSVLEKGHNLQTPALKHWDTYFFLEPTYLNHSDIGTEDHQPHPIDGGLQSLGQDKGYPSGMLHWPCTSTCSCPYVVSCGYTGRMKPKPLPASLTSRHFRSNVLYFFSRLEIRGGISSRGRVKATFCHYSVG